MNIISSMAQKMHCTDFDPDISDAEAMELGACREVISSELYMPCHPSRGWIRCCITTTSPESYRLYLDGNKKRFLMSAKTFDNENFMISAHEDFPLLETIPRRGSIAKVELQPDMSYLIRLNHCHLCDNKFGLFTCGQSSEDREIVARVSHSIRKLNVAGGMEFRYMRVMLPAMVPFPSSSSGRARRAMPAAAAEATHIGNQSNESISRSFGSSCSTNGREEEQRRIADSEWLGRRIWCPRAFRHANSKIPNWCTTSDAITTHCPDMAVKYVNKMPEWNSKLGSLVLKFEGNRILTASAKNFLIYEEMWEAHLTGSGSSRRSSSVIQRQQNKASATTAETAAVVDSSKSIVIDTSNQNSFYTKSSSNSSIGMRIGGGSSRSAGEGGVAVHSPDNKSSPRVRDLALNWIWKKTVGIGIVAGSGIDVAGDGERATRRSLTYGSAYTNSGHTEQNGKRNSIVSGDNERGAEGISIEIGDQEEGEEGEEDFGAGSASFEEDEETGLTPTGSFFDSNDRGDTFSPLPNGKTANGLNVGRSNPRRLSLAAAKSSRSSHRSVASSHQYAQAEPSHTLLTSTSMQLDSQQNQCTYQQQRKLAGAAGNGEASLSGIDDGVATDTSSMSPTCSSAGDHSLSPSPLPPSQRHSRSHSYAHSPSPSRRHSHRATTTATIATTVIEDASTGKSQCMQPAGAAVIGGATGSGASSSAGRRKKDRHSRKSKQPIDAADIAVLQFGKSTSTRFILDFRHPVSPLQAFGIALSTFAYQENYARSFSRSPNIAFSPSPKR